MCFNIYSKKLNTRQFVTQKLVTFSILHFTISKINFDEKKKSSQSFSNDNFITRKYKSYMILFGNFLCVHSFYFITSTTLKTLLHFISNK